MSHILPTAPPARRSRWTSAIGAGLVAAAVAVSIGAWRAGAAPSPLESTFVPVTPTRVLDTRDPTDLGLTGPFVSQGSQDLRVTGVVPTAGGDALVVPDGATGVLLNVTAVNATLDGFVAIRPADAPGSPTTSNLNFELGDIVPNAVVVAVPTAGPDAGRIEITYDAYGNAGHSTDLLIDVVGYTTNAGLADLQAQLDTNAANDAAQQAELDSLENTRTAWAGGDQSESVGATDEVVRQVTMTIPANGNVIVSSTANVFENTGDLVRCSITAGSQVDSNNVQLYQGTVENPYATLSGTRLFPVQAGFVITFRLVCDVFSMSGTAIIEDSMLTALFSPG